MRGADVIGVVLSVGIATAINLFVIAVLYDAIFSEGPGLSSNATQILNGWGTGVLGVVGAVVGYRAGESSAIRRQAPSSTAEPTTAAQEPATPAN